MTLALTLTMFPVSAKAQDCPDGLSQTTVPVFAGGCLWDVDICNKCGMISADQIMVFGAKQVDPNCSPTVGFNALLAQINDQVFNWDFIKTYICPDAELVPCDEYPYGLWYTLSYQMCWSKQIDSGHLIYFTCLTSQTICYSLYKYCWDPVLGKAVRILVQGPEISGSFSCDNVLEPLIAPLAPNWSTCFEVSSSCNP